MTLAKLFGATTLATMLAFNVSYTSAQFLKMDGAKGEAELAPGSPGGQAPGAKVGAAPPDDQKVGVQPPDDTKGANPPDDGKVGSPPPDDQLPGTTAKVGVQPPDDGKVGSQPPDDGLPAPGAKVGLAPPDDTLPGTTAVDKALLGQSLGLGAGLPTLPTATQGGVALRGGNVMQQLGDDGQRPGGLSAAKGISPPNTLGGAPGMLPAAKMPPSIAPAGKVSRGLKGPPAAHKVMPYKALQK